MEVEMKKRIIFSLLITSLIRIYSQQAQDLNPLVEAQKTYTQALTNLINEEEWGLVLQGIMYPVEFTPEAMAKLGTYINSDKFKKMSQDNKHLEKLRQELGLDPDY